MTSKTEEWLSSLVDHEPGIHGAESEPAESERYGMAQTVRKLREARAYEPPTEGFAERGLSRIREELAGQERPAVIRQARRRFVPRLAWTAAAAAVLLVAAILSPWRGGAPVSASELRVTGSDRILDLGVQQALFPRYVPGTERISYEQNDGILLWDRNAGSTEPLKRVSSYMRDAAWSPDGRFVVFSSPDPTRSGSSPGIWVLEPDSGHVTAAAVPPDPDTSYGTPAWSPDGSRIAFTAVRATLSDTAGVVQTNTVMTVKADGTDLRVAAEDGSEPAWSPDGTKLAFARDGDSGPSVWITEVADAGVDDGVNAGTRRIAEGRSPAWSPNGAYIAYAKTTAEHRTLETDSDGAETFGADIRKTELWAVNVANVAQTQLTHSGDPQELLASMLAESKSRGDASAVYAVSGTNDDDAPSWSSDGKRILFSRNTVSESGPHFTLQELTVEYR